MRVLGIHDGHTSTACLLQDGVIIGAISEERLTHVKGQGGFPVKSVEKLLCMHGLTAADIDKIALVGYLPPLTSISEYSHGRQKYFPMLIKYCPVDPRNLIKWYVTHTLKQRLKQPSLIANLAASGFPLEKVELVEHHQSHASTAYYLSQFHQMKEKTLVVTLDGSGDGLSGTFSLVDENCNWERLHTLSTFDSLGMIYSRVTQYLAMKPWEHEYKLMGMAPYASENDALRVYRILGNYIRLSDDGLSLVNPNRLWGNSVLDKMFTDFRGHRFDAVAAGVQLLHEKLVTQLLRNWLQKTGLGNIAVAGGCFMNVKANKLLLELPEVKDAFIMPSSGDESCAIGAALWCYTRNNKPENPGVCELADLYWGPDFSEEEIVEALENERGRVAYRLVQNIEIESAKMLAEHKIIGRLNGRMEWGARALGNRSILANPSRPQNLQKLNTAIKMRDFWMPFAPSILWERRKDYAVWTRDVRAYYMTLAYESTAKAREHLIAALHPYDFTMRPQFVTRENNPSYHTLISEFEKLTGIGGVLNTSFNLHGLPIVYDPEDAIRTLLSSHLDYITINDYLVWKLPD